MHTQVLQQDTSNEIVTLDDYMDFARITDLYDEPTVLGCIATAQELVSNWLNKMIFPSMVLCDTDLTRSKIELPFPPVHAVSNVAIVDMMGNEIPLDESQYAFSAIRRTMTINPFVQQQFSTHNITFTIECGYGVEGHPVPEIVRHAIMQTANTAYNFREDVYIAGLHRVPLDVQRMLALVRDRPRY